MLGLAQLYQIRGRIGRQRPVPPTPTCSTPARSSTPDRPDAAAAACAPSPTTTELGPGFKIAHGATWRSCGAGNPARRRAVRPGVRPSGFEMYAQLLEEAVAEQRGEPAATLAPVRLEIPVTAYVPPDYIAYEATKIDAPPAHRPGRRSARPGRGAGRAHRTASGRRRAGRETCAGAAVDTPEGGARCAPPPSSTGAVRLPGRGPAVRRRVAAPCGPPAKSTSISRSSTY